MNINKYFVYIISNWNNKIIYVGVTNNLERRMYEYRNKLVKGFSKKYNLTKLVYYEFTNDVKSAIQREKEIKKWKRKEKDKLIESMNPKWEELSDNDKGKISQSNKKDILLRNDNYRITGLIISAGLSQRMRKFKPLLHFSGKSFLKNVTEKLSKVCKEIIIVTGHNAKLIEEHIADWEENLQKKIKLVYNANYERGMFTSLKIGMEQCNTNWLLYHFVDQPNLPQNFYTEFTKASSNNCDWLQPTFNSRKGHPILFNKKVMKIIANSDDNSNLRNITTERIINKKYWNCNYQEILSDFDTPENLIELIVS